MDMWAKNQDGLAVILGHELGHYAHYLMKGRSWLGFNEVFNFVVQSKILSLFDSTHSIHLHLPYSHAIELEGETFSNWMITDCIADRLGLLYMAKVYSLHTY